MASKFTFKDAKLKIANLEQEIIDLKDKVVADVKDDTSSIGFGDIAFFLAGAVVTAIAFAIFS